MYVSRIHSEGCTVEERRQRESRTRPHESGMRVTGWDVQEAEDEQEEEEGGKRVTDSDGVRDLKSDRHRRVR